MPRRAADRHGRGRKAGAQQRQHRATQEVAGKALIRVAVVLDPGKPPRTRPGEDIVTTERQHGSQQRRSIAAPLGLRDPAHSPESGAAQKLEENGFGLVVAVMAQYQPVDFQPGQRGIAGVPRSRLDAAAGRSRRGHLKLPKSDAQP